MRKSPSLRARLRSVRHRPAAATACCAIMAASLMAQQAVGATSSSVHLAGRVYEQAALIISQLSLSISSNGANHAAPRKITGGGTIWLTDLGVSGNGAEFIVSVHSRNSEVSGHPSLVDSTTGATIPYRLNFDGAPVDFNSGEALLGKGRTAADPIATPRPLALVLPSDANVAQARYREQIVVVIQAR